MNGEKTMIGRNYTSGQRDQILIMMIDAKIKSIDASSGFVEMSQ